MSLRDPILAVHIVSGVLGLLLGPIAMRAPKRRGRHSRVGGVYHWMVLTVCVSAGALSVLNWDEVWWLLPIAVFSYANALLGYLAVRRKWRGWLRHHIAGMGGSYIALVTAALVVNLGATVPLAWVLPTAIGSPLIAVAIARARHGPLRRLALR